MIQIRITFFVALPEKRKNLRSVANYRVEQSECLCHFQVYTTAVGGIGAGLLFCQGDGFVDVGGLPERDTFFVQAFLPLFWHTRELEHTPHGKPVFCFLTLHDNVFQQRFSGLQGSGLPCFQPASDAQPRLLRYQHFVFQLVAPEKHTFAVDRCYGLNVVGMVDAQFPAVLLLPFRVQIHDHGKCAAFVAAKLIEVPFVKTTCFVQGIVKLITRNAGITGLVEVGYKAVHQGKKQVLIHIVVLPVEPVNFVASKQLVVQKRRLVANTRRLHLLSVVERI